MAVQAKPRRPQTRITFRGKTTPRVSPGFADVVAIPITHDWGPVGQPVEVNSFAEFETRFGDTPTEGRNAVLQAFLGQNLLGAGGAGGVLVYRMGVPGAGGFKAATVTLQNSTPAPALQLDALWPGTRGNLVAYTITDDPRDATRDVLKVYFNGAEVERYSYPQTNIAFLVASINDRPSNYVKATQLITGTALAAAASPVSLTTGADGAAVTATQWTGATDALEFENFSIISPQNLTDAAIRTQLVTWAQAMNNANRPVMLVIGGAGSEVIDDAVARSVAIGDEHVLNLGVGTYTDDVLGAVLSTAQLAPRVAGILAARGEEHALTFARIGGLHAVGNTGPNSNEIETAIEKGVVVFSRATSADADLKIEMGVTTFSNPAIPDRPVEVFGDARLVRIMDIFVRGMKQWGDEIIIGNLPVNDDTRQTVRGEAVRRITDLRQRGLILPGDTDDTRPFARAEPPNDPALADAIPFEFGWQFSRTTNYILGNGVVR